MKRVQLHRAFALLVVVLTASACSSGGPAATIDGFDIPPERIEELHPEGADLDGEQEASSLFLIILHHVVSREAEVQFDLVPDDRDIEAALTARLGGDDVAALPALTANGITRERVLLEAELDVLRERLQRAFIDEGGPGVDLDAAYRTFLGVNSRACILMLAPASDEAVAEMERVTDGTATLGSVQDQLGDRVEPVDLGCDSPSRLPLPVQPVALDGEVGLAYLRTFSDGTVYVVGVTERDAPTLDEVLEEVKALAADSQGATLFNEWAFDLLRAADVTVDEAFGTWEPREGTGDVPTVVPKGETPVLTPSDGA